MKILQFVESRLPWLQATYQKFSEIKKNNQRLCCLPFLIVAAALIFVAAPAHGQSSPYGWSPGYPGYGTNCTQYGPSPSNTVCATSADDCQTWADVYLSPYSFVLPGSGPGTATCAYRVYYGGYPETLGITFTPPSGYSSDSNAPQGYSPSGPGGVQPLTQIGGADPDDDPEVMATNGNANASQDDDAIINNTGSVSSGDPMNVPTGNMFYHLTDYKTAGVNRLSFTRYYNSRGAWVGMLGINWRSTYDRFIWLFSSTSVLVQRADGQGLTFTLSGGVWSTDSDQDYTLTNSGTTWTLTDPNDTVETYINASGNNYANGAQALLQSIKARNGYTRTLAYNTEGYITSVTDSYSRSLTFAYNSNNLLSSITTPDGTTVSYGYTGVTAGQNLTTVTYSTSPATSLTYVYGNSSLPFMLTGVTDEDGNAFLAWTYDAYGRALTSKVGTGSNANITTVAYNDTTGSRTVTHPLGVVDTYTYSTLQNAQKVTQISRAATSTTAAATRTFTYDTNGFLASKKDWDGNTTTYTNNSHGLPTQIVEASGSSVARTTTISYDPTWVHLPHSITTPSVTTAFTYDSYGEQLTKTLTDTTTTSTPYSTNGQTRTWTNTWSNYLLATTKTPNGNTTTFGYDSTGALTSVKDALNHTTTITSHTGGGLPETTVDPNSITTTFTYDARQRLTSKAISASGATTLTTTYTVDPTGEITKVNPPSNAYISYTYDTAHRLIKKTNALGEYVSLTLDSLGDITAAKTYDSSSTLWKQHSGVFDALGRITEDIGGVSGENTYFTYDSNGNQLTVKDPNSHTTTKTFDALNRLSTSTDANSGETQWAYDAHDRPLTITDALSHATTYVYDGFGDAIQQVSPDSGTTVSHYDGDANLTSKTDALSVVTNYSWDALDRFTQRYIPSTGTYLTYNYDESGGPFGAGIGKLTNVSDTPDYVNINYSPLGIEDSEVRYNYSNVQLSAVYYSIDSAGRMQGYQYPSGMYMSYAFDAADNINQVSILPPGYTNTTPSQTVEWPAYGPFSGPTRYLSFGNSIGENLPLDLDYRTTGFQVTSGSTNLTNQTYTYDNASNLTGVSDTVSAANNQTLGFDVINRLTSAASGTGGYGSYSWTYDKVGNRLTQVLGSTTTNYYYTSGTNKLSAIGSTSVSTNANGNITSIPPANSSSAATFAYNSANRLASVSGSPTAASFVYDGWERRYSKTPSGSSAITYIYDTAGNMIEEQDGSYITDYIYANHLPVGLLTSTTGTSGGTLYYVQADRQGTPQFVTNGSGTVVWKTTYQPYGTTGLITSTLTTQNLRFPGQDFDVETGFYHNGWRDYMPNLGRYLQTDPIGLAGGVNTFAYAQGNPTIFVDPEGLAGRSPRFICTNCGAFTGGTYLPYCPECYSKSLDPEGEVPPLPTDPLPVDDCPEKE